MISPYTQPHTTHLWLAANQSLGHGSPLNNEDGEHLEKRVLRVLIVEDEFFISLDTKAILQALGHTVVGIAVSADQAIRIAEQNMPDIVLMDIRLADARDGIDAAEEIRNRFGIPSIFVTANTDPGTRRRAEAVRPLGFLEKPLTEQRLQASLAKIGR